MNDNLQFGKIYYNILENVMSMGDVEVNKRTGTRIRMMPQGASFVLHLGKGILPTCGLRKTKPWHAAAEAAWCLLGHDHINWLKKHSQVWNQFAGYDGKLPQAYGNRWRNWNKTFDQLFTALGRLDKDMSDRRIWITSYSPEEDLIDSGQATVPCPVGFTLSVMDSGLCSSLMIRSSDLYFGLPYDVMRHAFIMAAIAKTLGINLGWMRVTLAHPHVYQPQWGLVREMLQENHIVCPYIMLPGWNIEMITENPDSYVEIVKEVCHHETHKWPDFDPKSEVVK